MWGLPGPGIEPMSLPLAGGFLTTVPPGKPSLDIFKRKKQFSFLPLPEYMVKFQVFITAFPLEPHLKESSLSYTGLHLWLNFPVFLTVLYMLHLDLLMAKKAFF